MMFLLFLFFVKIFTKVEVVSGTAYYDEKAGFTFKLGIKDIKKGVAWGDFTKSLNDIGLDQLVLTTTKNSKISDAIKAKGAGYLEGVLTSQRVFDTVQDFSAFTWGERNQTVMPDSIKKFLRDNYNYMASLYKQDPHDPLYAQIELIRQQIDGFLIGVNLNISKPKNQITYEDLQVVMAFGDMLNIQDNSQKTKGFRWEQPEEYYLSSGHCSAIIKVADDLSDIFFAHNSWFYFSSMHRIFKEYNFYFSAVKATSISFQSYPGAFSSNDDFLISSKNLAIIETTNAIFNESLFDLIVPQSLMVWQRVVAATRLADNGEEWCKIFSRHISGTYSNQFMVITMDKFKKGEALEEGLLYVIEEMPGKVMYDDMTSHLAFGYWPSYNSPFFKEMFKYSGYEEYLKKNPDLKIKYDYQTSARSDIMRRDQTKIKDIESMKSFIRYNDYKNDPLSHGNSAYSIASRYDLSPTPKCFGAVDGTVSSINEWLLDGKIHFISSPTHNSYIKIFDWTKSDVCKEKIFLHTGIPDLGDFDWYEYKKTY